MLHLAQQKGISTVTYERGFIKDSLRFAHNSAACRFEIDELWKETAEQSLTPVQSARLDEYLLKWRKGKLGLINYWPEVTDERNEILSSLGLDSERPVVTMYTNILWDTSIQERDIAFDGMFDWVLGVIRFFSTHDDVQLVIRVHPAEVRLQGRETVERVIDRVLEIDRELPENIILVPPESPISSYTLVGMSRCVLVYSSTMGMEAALLGARVIVAGQTHYRGKGFTDDPSSQDEYFEILSHALEVDIDLSYRVELARRYAHSFFARSMLPFGLVSEPVVHQPQYEFDALSDLLPGKDEILDRICGGILKQSSFYLDEQP
jgi:hypothetical protein